MGYLVSSTYLTLDGVIGDPQDWPSTGEDGGAALKLQTDLLLESDALLMGRRTYEVFSASWPERSGDPYSDRINAMPKYVASTTLAEAGWHATTVLADRVADHVASLKEEKDLRLVQYGFGSLSRALLDRGLIDELRLWLHPFLVGTGDLLFAPGTAARLALTDSTILPSGIAVLTYRPL
ncbi:dihydrofolate reductase family protein [Streptomyces sp. DSM 44917]|uniref:Dihydrofolate reductase family protein n=1 Tax=Streptomyces boetiae TaxID=3075541 RepID=A0ABU2L4Q9_9ACTN|nr:dihydrofolate reductase family protein [Streptomyces sp. DSM 44917]MDT0306218.1 dihydrofolate reductase family protein [Streptomyces sp. DSM 44917]